MDSKSLQKTSKSPIGFKKKNVMRLKWVFGYGFALEMGNFHRSPHFPLLWEPYLKSALKQAVCGQKKSHKVSENDFPIHQSMFYQYFGHQNIIFDKTEAF